jgi:NTP pyrophosphatase (non-canonical NTP hydrolase)
MSQAPPLASQLDELKQRLRRFAAERDWERFHSPKNLAMALAAESGELAEHFRWQADAAVLPADALPPIEQELADVLIYLVRLADRLDVDLLGAVEHKMAIDLTRHPPQQT